jgi:hypothetical protein
MNVARRVVDRSGVGPLFAALVNSEVGRHRTAELVRDRRVDQPITDLTGSH